MRSRARHDLIGQPHTNIENGTMKTVFPRRYSEGEGLFQPVLKHTAFNSGVTSLTQSLHFGVLETEGSK